MDRKVSISDWNETQKKVTVELPPSEVQSEIDNRYREIAKTVKIKGFRPGKVPRSIIKSYYGKVIESEVAQDLINRTFSEVIEAHKIKPLAEADLENYEYREEGSFVYTVIVDVAPSFEAVGYKGMELKKPLYGPVDDDTILSELERLRREHASFEIIEDQAVEESITAIVDLKLVKEDGEEELLLEDFTVTCGEGGLYLQIEKGIVGLKAGESKVFSVTFEDVAPREDLKGKTVNIKVEVKSVGKRVFPEIDDNLAKDYGYESLESLKEAIRNRIEEERKERTKAILLGQIEKKLLEMHNIPVPQKAVLGEVNSRINDLEIQFLRQGIQIPKDAFRNERFVANIKPSAEETVKLRIILEKIAEQEGISISEEDENEIIANLSKVLRMPESEVREKVKNTVVFERMKDNRLRQKVLEFIENNATIVEVSPEEFNNK